jgi:chemotaxis response regulator CheB
MTNGPLGDTAADGSADAPVHADADAGVEVGDRVDNPHAAPSGFHVVGIGASAGGIEALREVLPDLPAGNVAYVIAQHMSAAHPSLLTQVLARETTMPVQEVAAGVRLQPGVVYVAPPQP